MSHPIITNLPQLLHYLNTKRHHDHQTLADLATKLDVTTSTVGYWLNGKRNIPAGKLLQLIQLLQCDLMILVKKTETGKPT